MSDIPAGSGGPEEHDPVRPAGHGGTEAAPVVPGSPGEPGSSGSLGHPPRGDVPVPRGPAPGLVYASFAPRLGAYVLDVLILGIPTVLLTVAALWPQLSVPFDRIAHGQQVGTVTIFFPLWLSLAGVILAFLYWTGQWALWGRTLGMRATQCRVVREEDGGPPTWGRATLRGVFFWGPGLVGGIPGVGPLVTLLAILGILLAFGDPRKQGWPDRLARTLVIRPDR